MKRRIPRAFTSAAIAAIVLASAIAPISAATAEPEDQAFAETLTERIVEAADNGVAADELSEAVGLPEEGPSSLVTDGARISATVVFDAPPTDDQLAQIEAVATLVTVFTVAPAIEVTVAPAELDDLGAIDGVTSVSAAIQPSHGGLALATEDDPDARVAAPQAGTGTASPSAAESCRAIPVTADPLIASDAARARFDVDGTGVTVGIISDSFASTSAVTTPAQDIALGVLPGPGNPCGYETAVTVLSDSPGDDEGRAMAQLVHGIAPGARMLFAAGGNGQISMAQAINDLVAAGADVIVDDLRFRNELGYQQGIIGVEAAAAREQGVEYYKAVGNSNPVGQEGTSSEGKSLGGWSTAAYSATTCPAWVLSYYPWSSYDCLDFNPDGAPDASDDFGVDGRAPATIDLRWGEPAYGVSTDFQLQVYDATGPTPVLRAIGMVWDNDTPQRSIDFAGGVAQGTYKLVVVRNTSNGATSEPAISLSSLSAAGMTWREHDSGSASVTVGRSATGHAADGSTVPVAAVGSLEVDQPESYSAIGPGSILFEPVDTSSQSPSAALPEPLRIESPRIAAVDDLQTSFFGDDYPRPTGTVYFFAGTSAAAPVMAAVHALAVQYAPGIDPEEIVDQATSTATELTNPYTDIPDADVYGAGLVNANDLLGRLPAPAVAGLSAKAVNSAKVTARWNSSSAADSFSVELLSGGQVVQQRTLAADSSAASFTELQAETAYSVRVTSLNVAAEPGGSVTSVGVTTPRAVTPTPTQDPTPEPTVTPTPDPEPSDHPVTPVDHLAATGVSSTSALFGAAALLVVAGALMLAYRRRA